MRFFDAVRGALQCALDELSAVNADEGGDTRCGGGGGVKVQQMWEFLVGVRRVLRQVGFWCVAVCCGVMQCVVVCCGVVWCVVICCDVL